MKLSHAALAVLVIVLAFVLVIYTFTSKFDTLSKAVSVPFGAMTASQSKIDSELVSLKNEVGKLAFEVTKVSPPVVGHVHHTVRYFMIRAQSGQIQPNSIILVGDSITEGLFADRFCGIPVMNAGIGGAGVTAFVDFIDEIVAKAKPAVVVIAIGANDAHAKTGSEEDYVAKWITLYAKLVQSVKKGNAEPVLMTILPVEKDMDLGSKYFNANQIKLMNAKILEFAKNENLVAIDSFSTLADGGGFIKKGSTIDGVHLTAKSYNIWKNDINKGVAVALELKGIPCTAE